MPIIVSSVATVLLVWVEPRVHAGIQRIFDPSSLTGEYQATVVGYKHSSAVERDTYQYDVSIAQAGTTLYGEMKRTETAQDYRIVGYSRNQFISISYEDKANKAAGTGTFALQKRGTGSLVGYWVGVECKGGDRVLMQCPAVFSSKDIPDRNLFDSFVHQQCTDISQEVLASIADQTKISTEQLRCAPPDSSAKSR